jgi:integrase
VVRPTPPGSGGRRGDSEVTPAALPFDRDDRSPGHCTGTARRGRGGNPPTLASVWGCHGRSTPEKTFLTHEQVTDLADAAGEWQAVILVLSYCGFRWGEVAALRVERVDTVRDRINVAESVTEVGGK